MLVLAPVVFNPSPEARISRSRSHRPALSLAEHLAMQDLINTGTAILHGGGGGSLGRGLRTKRRWRGDQQTLRSEKLPPSGDGERDLPSEGT